MDGARAQWCRFFLLPLLLLWQGSTDGAIRIFGSLAYVVVGWLVFFLLDIWALYPSLGHRTVHHSSECTNGSHFPLGILNSTE